MAASGITPVTVLTGFLGSGKTTLLARLLREEAWRDTAVIVNEWGETGLDHAILREATDAVVQLPSGCLCCRVAGDLVRTLRDLHAERLARSGPAFRRVVVETTGLADPAPILATLAEMPLVAARYAVSGVVTTVDAEHGARQLRDHVEARRQVAMADRLVVTKADRVPAATRPALEDTLRAINPGAALAFVSPASALPERLLEAGLYRTGSGAPDAAGWLHAGAYRRIGTPVVHSADIVSFAWTAAEPFAPGGLESALQTLVEAMGSRLLRLKGLAAIEGEAGPRAVHAVGHTLYPSARLPAWPDADRSSRIVFIGAGLEESAVASILDSFRRTA
ncbi:MAG TPA: GTP-binding protein [Usitatibacter sp.]|jgi:G3E family GTPase|nr:GTP-binding protein [Usitatibacter sp.]